jgi:hypothetical protein
METTEMVPLRSIEKSDVCQAECIPVMTRRVCLTDPHGFCQKKMVEMSEEFRILSFDHDSDIL